MKKTKNKVLSGRAGTILHVICETPEAKEEFEEAIRGIKDLWIDWEQSLLSWDKSDRKKLMP